MDGRRIARRLGGPATRRRRHRRVAALLAGLAAIAGVMILLGSRSDDDADVVDAGTPTTTAPTTVAAACRASNEEIATAQDALLTDNTAPNAAELFLGDAFVDLTRERSTSIRRLDPGDDVLALVDQHDTIVDAIEADPAAAAGMDNPFGDLNEQWRSIDLPDCAIDSSTVVSG